MLLNNKKEAWEISRYSDVLNYKIVGSATKLLNFLLEKHSPSNVNTYLNMDWSETKLYYELGFRIVEQIKPNYKYILENRRVNKKNKVELLKVWDCGKNKLQLY